MINNQYYRPGYIVEILKMVDRNPGITTKHYCSFITDPKRDLLNPIVIFTKEGRVGFSSDDKVNAILETALISVKDILRNQKGELSLTEWLRLVQKVKENIIRHPEKLLNEDALIGQALEKLIEEQFYQFLKEEIVRYKR